MDYLKKLLFQSEAVISGEHFVYKSGKHGSDYIDKERFSFIGATELVAIIEEIGRKAEESGMKIELSSMTGIIGPAEGAVLFPLTLAKYFESRIRTQKGFFHDVKYFPAKTSVNSDGYHYIKEKLISYYYGKNFIIFEDIVNGGTTIREVCHLLRNKLNAKVLAALCFIDRGGQTAASLGIPQYFPGLRMNMSQYSAKECPLCKKGVPINSHLGKGKKWIDLFGQPPYDPKTDFSSFWNE